MRVIEEQALRLLSKQPMWDVDKLPTQIDVNVLRCLDEAKCIEARFIVMTNSNPSGSGPWVPVPHVWFSPIDKPGVAGPWDTILRVRPGDTPSQIRVSERGQVVLSRMKSRPRVSKGNQVKKTPRTPAPSESPIASDLDSDDRLQSPEYRLWRAMNGLYSACCAATAFRNLHDRRVLYDETRHHNYINVIGPIEINFMREYHAGIRRPEAEELAFREQLRKATEHPGYRETEAQLQLLRDDLKDGFIWCKKAASALAEGGAEHMKVLIPAPGEQIAPLEIDLKLQEAERVFSSLQVELTLKPSDLAKDVDDLEQLRDWFDLKRNQMTALNRSNRPASKRSLTIDEGDHHTSTSAPDDVRARNEQATLAVIAETQPPIPPLPNEDDLAPLNMFPAKVQARLKKAVLPNRKSKRVRFEVRDGQMRFCISDARRIWMADMRHFGKLD